MTERTSTLVPIAAAAVVFVAMSVAAAPAVAQRLPFERTFTASPGAVLEVLTTRGAIDVSAGSSDQIVVQGTATVRLGFNVPANALELAQRVAANPPIERDGNTFRLRSPLTDEEQRAVTVSYRVRVPAGTEVRSETDSGATTVAGVGGRVSVTSQSGAVVLSRLGGAATVLGSSGGVRVDDMAGDLDVQTQSGRITLRGLGAGLRVRTQSGGVDAHFTNVAHGLTDVETSSSGIELAGVRGGLMVSSGSGHVRASGSPGAPWDVTVRSSSVELFFDRAAPLNLEVTSGSGDVYVAGLGLQNTAIAKGTAAGTLDGGGPLVRASTRSGSVKVALGR
jgi:hypothetical protein